MSDDNSLSNRTKALEELLASQKTLLISTASASGVPDISYAPFVRDETGCFYVFISELAAHTDNLWNNPQASIMFIRSEEQTRNPFARERVILKCNAKQIDKNDPTYSLRLVALQEEFGEVVSLLRSLSDFHLFALLPETGRYIAGFGQAYTINTKDFTLSPFIKKHG